MALLRKALIIKMIYGTFVKGIPISKEIWVKL